MLFETNSEKNQYLSLPKNTIAYNEDYWLLKSIDFNKTNSIKVKYLKKTYSLFYFKKNYCNFVKNIFAESKLKAIKIAERLYL